jgi:hypothetical protein
MTGRAAGYCAGHDRPGYANPYGGRGYAAGGRGWYGRGCGRGRGGGRGPGRGRGWGVPWDAYSAPAGAQAPWGPAPAPSPEDEIEMLRQQAEHLQGALEDISGRLQELERDEE